LLPTGPATADNQRLKVSALLSPVSNDWHLPAIQKHFPLLEATICQLIPSKNKTKDALVWLPEKRGSYSTKSGYAISKLHQRAPIQEAFNWQLNIWKVRVPPKLKMFLWKLKRKALPVGNNLAVRGILCASPCKRCDEVESELHILLACPFAKKV